MRAGAASGRELVRVGAAFSILTFVLAYPLSIRPGASVLPMGGDTRLFLWTLGWDVHSLTHRPWAIFDANIFAPERLTLAYSENCLGSALIAAPFVWLTGNLVLAMNAVVLLSCVLCGVGTYMLARQLGVSPAASVIAGLIFAFAPPRFLRIGQLHLAPVQWIAFCLAYLERYLDAAAPRDLKIAAVFFALQIATSGHAGAFLIVAVACVLFWRAVRTPAQLVRIPRDLGTTGIASLLLVATITVPYLLVRHEQGWVRTLEEARLWSPNRASFLESPSHVHRLVQSAFGWQTDRAKAALFPGFIPLGLAVIGLWRMGRDPVARGRFAPYLLLALVSLWLALGPDYGLYALAYKLPALNFIRVPSRYITLTLLAAAMFAASGFDLVTRSLSSRARVVAATAVALFLACEFAVVPLASVREDRALPAVDRWLSTRTDPFVVAEVPVVNPRDEARANSRQSIYMMHSTAHWQKTVHGYSGYEPPDHTALYRELLQFPDDVSLDHLGRLGVDYIVVHQSYYPVTEWPQVRERLVRYGSQLQLVYADRESRVYALRSAR